MDSTTNFKEPRGNQQSDLCKAIVESTHETPLARTVFLCILNLDWLPVPDQISSVIVPRVLLVRMNTICQPRISRLVVLPDEDEDEEDDDDDDDDDDHNKILVVDS
uniref:Uncharacterized protein n=1 Tax=Vespula pensylvanica TaxID=30213 RepID=A0A834K585_VESPE|nr:hypothetical protein H0235_015842 [Vespula pensylvanica]